MAKGDCPKVVVVGKWRRDEPQPSIMVEAVDSISSFFVVRGDGEEHTKQMR